MEENTMDMMERDDKAEAGRGTDTKMAHVTLGEIVLPLPVVANEELRPLLEKAFADAGVDINQYTIGHEANSINKETGYPEFGFFKKVFNAASKVGLPTLNKGFSGFTDGLQANAVVAGNYLLPGSSMLTSNLVSDGAQKKLDSGFYKVANIAAGAAGGGLGSSTTGIPSANSIGAGWGGLADATGLGDVYNSASGALSDFTGGIKDQVGNAYNGSTLQGAFKSGGDVLKNFGLNTSPDAVGQGVGATGGGGPSLYSAADQSILDTAIGNYTPNAPLSYGSSALNTGATSDFAQALGATGEAGTNNILSGATEVAKASTPNYASPIASALMGVYTNNKAEDQLLKQQKANAALYAPYQNFSFNPEDLTTDPGYKFNLEQGNQALDRAQLARGGYFSGEALKDAAKFSTGLADNTFGNAFNRALNTNQEGLRGANALAGVNDNIGNIRAGSTVNTGNVFSGALGSVLGGNSFTNSGALQGGGNDYLSNLLRQLKMQQLTGAMA